MKISQSTPMKILGIESSFDDTAISVVEAQRGKYTVLSAVFASQILMHKKTGGVVPEVAAREHAVTIMPTAEAALEQAGVWKGRTKKSARADFRARMHRNVVIPDIDLIAATAGPGLLTSLLVGAETGRTLSYAWEIPFIATNHIAGHVASAWLMNQPMPYPILALVVSGGHTELLLMNKKGHLRCLGATRDDAAGEAFDKTAKLLGLPYPGGPALSKLGANGNPRAVPFPRPMLNSPDFDFSFAGLKTSVLYHLKELQKLPQQDVAASIERAIVDVLVAKTARAAAKHKVKTVTLVGGVAANRTLRSMLAEAIQNQGRQFITPSLEFCTDNASMIAVAGYQAWQAGKVTRPNTLKVDPNWEIGR